MALTTTEFNVAFAKAIELNRTEGFEMDAEDQGNLFCSMQGMMMCWETRFDVIMYVSDYIQLGANAMRFIDAMIEEKENAGFVVRPNCCEAMFDMMEFEELEIDDVRFISIAKADVNGDESTWSLEKDITDTFKAWQRKVKKEEEGLDCKDGSDNDLVAVAANAVYKVWLHSKHEKKDFMQNKIVRLIRELALETEDIYE